MEIRPMETNDWNHFVIGRKHDQMVHHPEDTWVTLHRPLRDLYRFRTGSPDNYGWLVTRFWYFIWKSPDCYHHLKKCFKYSKDANEYVHGSTSPSRCFNLWLTPSVNPWIKGFNAQFGSTWGVAAGSGMLSFYLGRFWINQDLKKSMGH